MNLRSGRNPSRLWKSLLRRSSTSACSSAMIQRNWMQPEKKSKKDESSPRPSAANGACPGLSLPHLESIPSKRWSPHLVLSLHCHCFQLQGCISQKHCSITEGKHQLFVPAVVLRLHQSLTVNLTLHGLNFGWTLMSAVISCDSELEARPWQCWRCCQVGNDLSASILAWANALRMKMNWIPRGPRAMHFNPSIFRWNQPAALSKIYLDISSIQAC